MSRARDVFIVLLVLTLIWALGTRQGSNPPRVSLPGQPQNERETQHSGVTAAAIPNDQGPDSESAQCLSTTAQRTPDTCPEFRSTPYVWTEPTGSAKPVPLPSVAPPNTVPFSFPTDGFQAYTYSPNNRFGDFYGRLKGWEPNTFRAFYSMIGTEMLYVGFGEWVGPTVMYASHIAKQALGMDPDPSAFLELKKNADANKHLDFTVLQQCISDKKEVIQMVGTGQSGSSLAKTGETFKTLQKYGFGTFNVTCDTLPVFLASLRNDPRLSEYAQNDRRLFVKIDTEGAETFILPSLTEWVRCLPRKPVFFISTHDTPSRASPQERALVVQFFRSFRFVSVVVGSRDLSVHPLSFQCGADFTDSMLKDGTDYVASDILPVRTA